MGRLSFLMRQGILEEGLRMKGWGWADIYGALITGQGFIVTIPLHHLNKPLISVLFSLYR